MLKEEDKSVKKTPDSSDSGQSDKSIRETVGVQKKSPDDVLKGLFSEHFGAGSLLVKTLKQQKVDLDAHADVNKKLLNAISQSKNNGKPKVSPGQDALARLISSELKANSKKFAEVGKMFHVLQKETHQRTIESETNKFQNDLEHHHNQSAKETQPASFSPYTPSALEQIATRIFARGFHLTTGLISETWHKKILDNKSPDIQENKPASKQSPEHKNYLETKGMIQTLWNHFFTEQERVVNNEKPKNGPKDKDSNGASTGKKIEGLEKTVKDGDKGIIKAVDKTTASVDHLTETLLGIEHAKEDEKETAKFKKIKASKTALLDSPERQDKKQIQGSEGGGLISNALKGIETYIGTKAAEFIAKKVLPKVIPYIKGSPTMLRNLATRVVGTAAGTAVMGTAAVAAGYGMDKTSREMMDAQTEEARSQAAYEHSQGMMKRFNPKAYEITQLHRKIENLQLLKQTDSVKASIEQLKQKQVDILSENQKLKAAVLTKNTSSPQLPRSEDIQIEGQTVLVEKMDKVVTELKDGTLVDILKDIRDGIRNISATNAPTESSFHMLPMAGESPNGVSSTTSTISKQRNALRSNQ